MKPKAYYEFRPKTRGDNPGQGPIIRCPTKNGSIEKALKEIMEYEAELLWKRYGETQ